MTVASDSSSSGSSGNWLFKNKEHGKTSAAASLVFSLNHIIFLIYGSFKFHLQYLCYVICML